MQLDLVIILLIPAILFTIDTIGKIGFRVPIDSVGADLCMFSISFNISTIMMGTFYYSLDAGWMNQKQIKLLQQIYEWSFVILLVSFIAWFLTLTLVSNTPRFRIIELMRNTYRIDAFIAFFIGLFTFYLEIALVVTLILSIL